MSLHNGITYVSDIHSKGQKIAFTENSRQFLNLINFFGLNLLKDVEQEIQIS